MEKKDISPVSPVQVRHSVDSWQRLVHTLKQAVTGKFLVTVHNGEVIKVARFEKEVRISATPRSQDTIPAP